MSLVFSNHRGTDLTKTGPLVSSFCTESRMTGVSASIHARRRSQRISLVSRDVESQASAIMSGVFSVFVHNLLIRSSVHLFIRNEC